MTRFALLFAATSMFFSTGCATLMASKTDSLSITSDPDGAEVRVNGSMQGRTPAIVEVDKARPGIIEVRKPGYETNTCHPRMSPKVGYVVADVLICAVAFPLGCLSFIDASGAWNELDQSSCNVSMNPALASMPPPPQPQFAPVPAAAPVSSPAYQVPAGYQLVPAAQPVQAPPPGYQLVPASQPTARR